MHILIPIALTKRDKSMPWKEKIMKIGSDMRGFVHDDDGLILQMCSNGVPPQTLLLMI